MAALTRLVMLASLALSLYGQSASEQLAAHAQAAQEAEKRNDFPTAVHEFEYVAGQLPRNAEVQSNLGVALYFDHELTRAIAVFRRAMALNPDLLAPHLFSGLAWYRLSNPDAAVPELENAVRINSSDVIARTWLGYAYVAQSRYVPALKQFQTACQLDPHNIDVWYALGQTYLQIGKDATVQLLAVAPDGGRTWQLAGEQEKLQGHRVEALQDFQGALARRPDIPELGGTAAASPGQPTSENRQEDDLYWRAHDAEQKARAAFEHVVQIAPDSYRAHEIMADALAAQQREGEAIGEYRTVLKLNPDLPGIHEAIGKNLLRTGKTAEAFQEFESELQIQPRSAAVYSDLGQALLLMGKDDQAGKMLARALEMDRPPPETYRLLGKLDLRRKEYRSAVAVLTHYVSIDKHDSNAYYLLSTAYRELGEKGQMEHALDLYKKTSRDAKARSRAQQELERLSDQKQPPEEAAELKQTAAH